MTKYYKRNFTCHCHVCTLHMYVQYSEIQHTTLQISTVKLQKNYSFLALLHIFLNENYCSRNCQYKKTVLTAVKSCCTGGLL